MAQPSHVDAVDQHAPGRRAIEADQDFEQRALPAPDPPMMTATSPCPIVMLTSRSTRLVPKDFSRCSTTMWSRDRCSRARLAHARKLPRHFALRRRVRPRNPAIGPVNLDTGAVRQKIEPP